MQIKIIKEQFSNIDQKCHIDITLSDSLTSLHSPSFNVKELVVLRDALNKYLKTINND